MSRLWPDAGPKIRLIWTDPPYGVDGCGSIRLNETSSAPSSPADRILHSPDQSLVPIQVSQSLRRASIPRSRNFASRADGSRPQPLAQRFTYLGLTLPPPF